MTEPNANVPECEREVAEFEAALDVELRLDNPAQRRRCARTVAEIDLEQAQLKHIQSRAVKAQLLAEKTAREVSSLQEEADQHKKTVGVVSSMRRAQCTATQATNELFDQQSAKLSVLERFAQRERATSIRLRAEVTDLTSERAAWVSRETNFEKSEIAQQKRARDLSAESARLQAREKVLEQHELRIALVTDDNAKQKASLEVREERCLNWDQEVSDREGVLKRTLDISLRHLGVVMSTPGGQSDHDIAANALQTTSSSFSLSGFSALPPHPLPPAPFLSHALPMPPPPPLLGRIGVVPRGVPQVCLPHPTVPVADDPIYRQVPELPLRHCFGPTQSFPYVAAPFGRIGVVPLCVPHVCLDHPGVPVADDPIYRQVPELPLRHCFRPTRSGPYVAPPPAAVRPRGLAALVRPPAALPPPAWCPAPPPRPVRPSSGALPLAWTSSC